MRPDQGFDYPSPSYTVENMELARQIDDLVRDLKADANAPLLRELFVTGAKLAQENCARGDLKILSSAIKEMRYGFKVFAQYRDIPKISIFGSARCQPGSPEYQTALEFSRKMAEAGYMIMTGAGGGIMAAANRGAGRERSFGLNISLPFEQSANETIRGDEKLINFRYFFTRKLFFVKESDAMVLMPGGLGTLDEGFESLTLVQTGKNEPTPIVMLDRPGGTYWRDWFRFVEDHVIRAGYIAPDDAAFFLVTDDVEAACQEIKTFYRRYHSSRYVQRRKNLVIRLKEALSDDWVARLNRDFTDILVEGAIEPCGPYPEESDEPELRGLPRLTLQFDQHHFGRLRQLIDRINQF